MFQIEIHSKTPTMGAANRPVEFLPNSGGGPNYFVGQLLSAVSNLQPAVQSGSPVGTNNVLSQESGIVAATPLQASDQGPEAAGIHANIEVAPIAQGWPTATTAATNSFEVGEAHLAGSQDENGTRKEQGDIQIESVPHPNVNVTPMDLSATGVSLAPPNQLFAASSIPAPNMESVEGENQRPIDRGESGRPEPNEIPSLLQSMPGSETPRDGLEGVKVGPSTLEPSLLLGATQSMGNTPDTKPKAQNTHLSGRVVGEQTPVENLAPSIAQMRQSIDDHIATDTADRKIGAYATPAPTFSPPSHESGAMSGFQNLINAGPAEPNIATFAASMPISNAKPSLDTAPTRSEAPILTEANAQPKLDDRVRVVQSDNNTIRLLAEADTLGKMAISLSLFENGTEVAFRTESAETARQLHGAGSQLATRLDEVGGRQSRVTVEMTDHGGLSNGFAQDGSRQSRSSENWFGSKASQSAAVGTEIGADARLAPHKTVRLA